VLDLDEARASDLARWTTFFEIYSLEADGDWVHVRRLRDERLLLTAQHPWLLSNLGRSAVLALSSDGETKVVRYTHGHPPDVTRNKRVAVCDQGEGQCFRYSKDPARK
jgi:hypothetical protein